ncbi:hypothetical protein [Streptoalloteichus tenebrarius]|uniref:hypothetical protein n=1 Tax=Streptoalloteichus tenebrarius (strain ATCC 17920 / DSM 40477 / JCM 4838 / CBS 697.72 / NBRC 16177 / NCIMB 11028 / NRRL B-12390 / A12253. 1 / ISP 5477) TaxID=1933 RepID=UPI0020A3B0D3|nr:hypothetical protein [Streptoalloteichus tenebrarius]
MSFVSGVALGLATAGAPAEPGRVPCDGRSAPAACVWDSQVQRCRGTCGQGRVCAQVDDTRNCYCVRPEASSARGRAARAD